MTEITLAKRTDAMPTPAQAQLLRDYLFEVIDGLSEEDRKSWRRFWKWIMAAGSGEIFSVETWAPRHGGFHKMHMVMETKVFQAQERIQNFEQFRLWLKMGAGFVDWMAGPRGGVVPVPRSVSYKKCDEDVMRQFHLDAIAFLRTEHAQRYLWKHLDANQSDQMMDVVLRSFS